MNLGIVVGVIDDSGDYPLGELRSNRIITYGNQDQTNFCLVDGNTLFEIGFITTKVLRQSKCSAFPMF
jgi:hypothetical protein